MTIDYSDKKEILRKAQLRPPSDSNYLSEAEITYILTGETGTYQEGNLDGSLQNKSDDLRVRIQRLINDIALLRYGGYLDHDNDIWDELLGISGFARMLSERNTTLTRKETDWPAVTFGYELGLVFTMLTGPAFRDPRGADFLWGFLLANSTPRDGDPESEKRYLESVLQKLDDRRKIHIEERYGYFSKYRMDEPLDEDPDTVAYVLVKEILADFGLKAPPFLRQQIASFASTDLRYNRASGKKDAVRQKVKKFCETTCLPEVEELRAAFIEEWETIEDATNPAITGYEVMKIFHELDKDESVTDDLTSKKIAKAVEGSDSEWKYKKGVTWALNRLAKNGKDPSFQAKQTFVHAPLVEWDGEKWKKTDYGKGFCRFVFDEERDPEWLYKIGWRIDPENGPESTLDEDEWELIKNAAEAVFDTNPLVVD